MTTTSSSGQPTFDEAVKQLANIVATGSIRKINWTTLEKLCLYIAGGVAAANPSSIFSPTIREVVLGAVAFIIGTTHVKTGG